MLSKYLSITAATALLAPRLVLAIGDYACTDISDCSALGTEVNATISNNSQCVPDPADPSSSYCGYVGATCDPTCVSSATKNCDCDYGKCGSDGKCAGYLGDACYSLFDCLAYFDCAGLVTHLEGGLTIVDTPGVCGGANAQCVEGVGNAACLSGECSSPDASEDGTCAAPPADGVVAGSPCGNDDVCASGICTDYICQAALAPSQGGNRRRALSNFKAKMKQANCPAGFTACQTELGIDCIDTETSLESCGGCKTLQWSSQSPFASVQASVGVDCSTIANADQVKCEGGECVIVACSPGFKLAANGQSCL